MVSLLDPHRDRTAPHPSIRLTRPWHPDPAAPRPDRHTEGMGPGRTRRRRQRSRPRRPRQTVSRSRHPFTWPPQFVGSTRFTDGQWSVVCHSSRWVSLMARDGTWTLARRPLDRVARQWSTITSSRGLMFIVHRPDLHHLDSVEPEPTPFALTSAPW